MTLNHTIFPALPFPTISVDFNNLILGRDGSSPELLTRRMGVYVERLDERLENEPPWIQGPRLVIAHSFGGMLALAWWLAHGGQGVAQVAGMVLIATTAGPMFDVVRLRVAQLGELELRAGVRTLIRFWNLPAVTRGMKRILTGGSLEARAVDFRALPARSDWALDRAGWRNTDWRSMRSYRCALEGFDIRALLGRIAIPVIVLHGTADTLLPLSVARDLASRLPQAELRVVPGAGHALPLTHGNAVVKAVRDLAASEARK
jgi:pimeloyl-ACP methyl ester carboxylesterase